MHSDMKEDVIATAHMYTSCGRLKEVICNEQDVVDKVTQHNKAVGSAVINMTPKKINYVISCSFYNQMHHMASVHNLEHA
eukprot:14012288-Ditylum_brightwellii.AAC.1